MADQFKYRKLPPDPCLTQEQMLAYIDGKLSAADQHTCERHMADCEMCEDAMEGLSLVKDRSVLSAPLKTEIAAPSEGKVVPLQPPQPNRKLWYAAAAVLVVVLGSVFILKNLNNSMDESKSMADNTRADSISMPHDAQAPVALNDSEVSGDKNAEAEKSVIAQTQSGNLPVAGWKSMEGVAEDQPVTADIAPRADNDQESPPLNTIAMDDQMENETEVVNQQPVNLKEQDEKSKEEADKKGNFWDRTKATVQQSSEVLDNDNRSEKPNKDGFVNNDDQKNDVPDTKTPTPKAANDAVTSPPVQPNAGVTLATGSSQADSTSGSGTFANATQDAQELNYQNGMNLMNSGQANAAITLFDKILADKNNARYEDAEFQKANALIKADRKEEAKALLKSIEAKKGKHAAEATELLKTIQ